MFGSRFKVKTSQYLLWIISKSCTHTEKLEIFQFLKGAIARYNKQKLKKQRKLKENSVVKPTEGKKAGKNLSRKARRQLEKDILAGKRGPL